MFWLLLIRVNIFVRLYGFSPKELFSFKVCLFKLSFVGMFGTMGQIEV